MKHVFAFLIIATMLSCLVDPSASAQPKRDLMRDAHALVFDHAKITRVVEKLPNGVRTITTTSNPDLLPILRKHPRQMGELYQQGGMVRGWDPLFRELAVVSDKVKMESKDIENGVEVLSTSEDPEVVKLIQAHADKVSDMAKRGVPAMQEATEIPAGYSRPGADSPPPDATATESVEAWDGALVQFGSMHEAIGQQQHQGRVSLKEVIVRPNFYGVGALEKLTGELTILDGVATITQVNAQGNPLPADATSSEMMATLLVGAYVPHWTEHTIESAISPDNLDQFIEKSAAKAGIDISRPFVFSLDGEFTDARLHIINGACPMHARLKKLELPKGSQPFEVDMPRVQGTLLGVYAKDSVGKLTHPGTFTHIHLKYVDESTGAAITGHLEQIGLSAGSVLHLPLVR